MGLQDYIGNKRLELSGQLLALLFEVSISFFFSSNNVDCDNLGHEACYSCSQHCLLRYEWCFFVGSMNQKLNRATSAVLTACALCLFILFAHILNSQRMCNIWLNFMFQDLFKSMNDQLQFLIDRILSKASRSSRFDVSQVCHDYIGNAQIFTYAIYFSTPLPFFV